MGIRPAKKCPECGTLIPQDAPMGYCPACLVRLGADGLFPLGELEKPSPASESASPEAASGAPRRGNRGPGTIAESPPPTLFGGYELLSEIGRGGMGVVYRARELAINRIVAVKMLLHGRFSGAAFIERFHLEAEAAAHLDHPNIVPIYEVGQHDGQPFYCMKLIEGQSLDREPSRGPMPPKKAAQLIATVARAVAFAHHRGVLHRDIKPHNILLDAAGQPHLTDFGLAKLLDRESGLTLSSAVMGSPGFMAPEQAAGKPRQVTTAADVYGLGAVLYALLTGKAVFQAETPLETVRLVIEQEPVRPRVCNPSVDRDLETICLKCLQKEPAKRYASAQALAEDLECWLRAEPIQARPVGATGRAWLWCRRQPVRASLVGALAFSFALGMSGVLWQWRRAKAGEALARERGYAADMNLAQQALIANDVGRAVELLERHRPPVASLATLPSPLPADLRGWEWRFLWQQCRSDAEFRIGSLLGPIRNLEVSSDGRFLAASSEFGEVKCWDLLAHTATDLVGATDLQGFLAFSPDGRMLAFTDQDRDRLGKIGLWDTQTSLAQRPILLTNEVGSIRFAQDGRWLACLAFFPDANEFNRQVLVLGYPALVEAGKLTCLTPASDNRKGYPIVFTPDHHELVCSETDGRIMRWNSLGGNEPRFYQAHQESVTAIAISPDGRTLATGGGYRETGIKLWKYPEMELLTVLTNHQGWISDLRFSPDGLTLASSSSDQTIRFWDRTSLAEKGVLRGHRHEVMSVCFSADGRKVFSGARDGTIYRWPAEPVAYRTELQATPTDLSGVALSPDAAQFAGLRDGQVCFGETGRGTLRSVTELGTNNSALLFSLDGQLLFAGTRTGEIQVWNLGEARNVRTLRGPSELVRRLRIAANGGWLLAVQRPSLPQVSTSARLTVWSTANWQPLVSLSNRIQPNEPVSHAVQLLGTPDALSPNGARLAIGRHPRLVMVWDLTEGLRTHLLDFVGPLTDLAFSPDGRFLAACSLGGSVKIWDATTLREEAALRVQSGGLWRLAFSPDGRRLAIGNRGVQAVRLWDLATLQPLITLLRKDSTISELAFTSDGNGIAALNADKNEILLWRAPSWAEITAAVKKEATP